MARIAGFGRPRSSSIRAKVPAEIAHTPAARPSSPSRKLTMFITATIPITVSGRPSQRLRDDAELVLRRRVVVVDVLEGADGVAADDQLGMDDQVHRAAERSQRRGHCV